MTTASKAKTRKPRRAPSRAKTVSAKQAATRKPRAAAAKKTAAKKTSAKKSAPVSALRKPRAKKGVLYATETTPQGNKRLGAYFMAVMKTVGMFKANGTADMDKVVNFMNSPRAITYHVGKGNITKDGDKVTLTAKGYEHFQERLRGATPQTYVAPLWVDECENFIKTGTPAPILGGKYGRREVKVS